MGRRQFTVRTLLVWMVLFALLCGGLSASGAPLPLFVALFTWVAVVWYLTLLCSPRLALGVSIAIPVFYGAVLVLTARSSKGPPPPDVLVGPLIVLGVLCVLCGVCLYFAIVFINRLIEPDKKTKSGDDDADHRALIAGMTGTAISRFREAGAPQAHRLRPVGKLPGCCFHSHRSQPVGLERKTTPAALHSARALSVAWPYAVRFLPATSPLCSPSRNAAPQRRTRPCRPPPRRANRSAPRPPARCAAPGPAPRPVRALDPPGVQGDALGGRIETKFQRVVAGLAMNIDRAGQGRRPIIGKPPSIRPANSAAGKSRPPRRCADGPIRSGPTGRLAGPRRCPARGGRGRPPGRPAPVAAGDEDVRKLVIDQRPSPAGLQVEVFAVRLLANFEQSGLAEHAIGMAT